MKIRKTILGSCIITTLLFSSYAHAGLLQSLTDVTKAIHDVAEAGVGANASSSTTDGAACLQVYANARDDDKRLAKEFKQIQWVNGNMWNDWNHWHESYLDAVNVVTADPDVASPLSGGCPLNDDLFKKALPRSYLLEKKGIQIEKKRNMEKYLESK